MPTEPTQTDRSNRAQPVCVTLHQRDVDRLDQASEQLGVSRSAACRMAVRQFLQRVAPERLATRAEGHSAR